MKARRLLDSDLDGAEDKNRLEDSVLTVGPLKMPVSMDDAAEAADEMAAKSAVLVEMMEDLEERLRLRVANLSDHGTVYTRKVRRFQSDHQSVGGGRESFSGHPTVEETSSLSPQR